MARHVDASLPTVTRELARLHDAEIIEATPVGRRAVYSLNVRHPLAEVVREIAMFTHGPQPVVARELLVGAGHRAGGALRLVGGASPW
ncbi:MAG: winged helix-turn-helix domain-containing protein [Microcella pacifica]